MRYKVALKKTEEGVSVSVPALPGCCSQGENEQEAMENIADAIKGYLDVTEELFSNNDYEIRELQIAA